jgi:superoxide dismutase, Fe-Mn family
MSMFGNGYVWLMSEDRDGFSGSALEARVGGPLRILCTYNAGSPFAKAHRRQQAVDRNTGISRVGARLTGGHFGDNSRNPMEHQPLAFVGEPLLCLKVWEHQWMRDYGLAGKERYIRNWWDRIDWDEVHARLNVAHNPRERIASPPMDESRASLHQYATNLPS